MQTQFEKDHQGMCITCEYRERGNCEHKDSPHRGEFMDAFKGGCPLWEQKDYNKPASYYRERVNADIRAMIGRSKYVD